MELFSLLGFLGETLERLHLSYLVTGSMATITYGEPRFTNDIDIVLDLPSHRIQVFCDAFSKDDFYLSSSAVREAVRNRHQFNILHPESGLKIDVMIASLSEFDRSRLQRGIPLKVLTDNAVMFASPEDVIIKKMEYYREGQSEKHLRDISGVIRVRGKALDYEYITHWANELELTEIWNQIQSASK